MPIELGSKESRDKRGTWEATESEYGNDKNGVRLKAQDKERMIKGTKSLSSWKKIRLGTQVEEEKD